MRHKCTNQKIDEVNLNISENQYNYIEEDVDQNIEESIMINNQEIQQTSAPVNTPELDHPEQDIQQTVEPVDISQPIYTVQPEKIHTTVQKVHKTAHPNIVSNKQEPRCNVNSPSDTYQRNVGIPRTQNVPCNISENQNDSSCYMRLEHKNINPSCNIQASKPPACSIGNNLPGYDDSNLSPI